MVKLCPKEVSLHSKHVSIFVNLVLDQIVFKNTIFILLPKMPKASQCHLRSEFINDRPNDASFDI